MKHAFLFFVLGLCFISCEKEKEPEAIVTQTWDIDIGGYQLNAMTRGNGEQTIVFEAGLGDDLTQWNTSSSLFNTLAEDYQVIIYNRAGYAPSEMAPVDKSRTITQIAADLDKIISEASDNDRVILVGHSFGGMIIRQFAHTYPSKVNGLLFIDPTHEDDLDRDNLQMIEDQQVPLFESLGMLHLAAEFDQMVENFDLVSGLGDLPDVPVRVLTSMLVDEEDGDTHEGIITKSVAHNTLGSGVTDFRQIQTDLSGHHIHHTEPELVIDALKQIVD